jgi:uncharacterized repeat protein (TIGR01451 family)
VTPIDCSIIWEGNSMSPRLRAAALSLLCSLLLVSTAHASLIPTIQNETSGTGLGAVNTVLTVQNEPTEAGCVAPDDTGATDTAAATACAFFPGISGSDTTSTNEVRTLAEVGVTSAFNLRVVFNYNENNTDDITLENLVLGIFSPDGTVLFTSEPFTPVTFTEPFNGTGTSGFVFRLDTQQAAAAQQFFANPNNLIGLAAELSQSSAGPETFYVGDATATTPASADLSIVKTDSSDPVAVGTPLTYTLTVTNDGPNNAQNVVVSDTLPASVTFQSATASQGACALDGRVVLCDLGTLSSGATATVDITVVPTAEGTVTNSASVSSDTADPDPTDNSDTEQTDVGPGTAPSADVFVTKTDSVDPATVGVPVTYTLTVGNDGPDAATGVTVTDTLPSSFTFVSATPSQGSCTNTGPVFVSCDLGTLASGATATVDITATPGTDDVTVTNTTSVSADQPDPDGTDNTDTETTTVGTGGTPATTDLTLTKVDTTDPVTVGTSFDYVLTVSTGADPATDVSLTDTVPASFTIEAVTPSQGMCAVSGRSIACGLGAIPAMGSATVSVTVTPNQPGTFTNVASVSADETDSNPADNGATEDTTVTAVPMASADLSVTKTDDTDPVMVGGTVTYTLAVMNDGPSAATGVTVTDVLPATVTAGTVTPSQGSCATSGQVVTCNLGLLGSGATATVTLEVTANQAGQITDNASVSGNEPDPDDTNNTATETTTVGTGAGPVADLRLVKTATPAQTEVGDTVTFEIAVFNDGPDAATGVTVVDTLPANFVYDTSMASAGTCMVTGGSTVVCELGTLAAGAMETVTLTAVADAEGVTTNTATVSGDEVDPDPADNTDTTPVTVGAPFVIPTLGEYALLLLALSIALGGMTLLRRA